VEPQAESSERPLRRRADKMARPARVRIRRRKPWVLARRRLLGWKVRLLTMISVTGQARADLMSAGGGRCGRGRLSRPTQARAPSQGLATLQERRHRHAKTADRPGQTVRERTRQGQTSGDQAAYVMTPSSPIAPGTGGPRATRRTRPDILVTSREFPGIRLPRAPVVVSVRPRLSSPPTGCGQVCGQAR